MTATDTVTPVTRRLRIDRSDAVPVASPQRPRLNLPNAEAPAPAAAIASSAMPSQTTTLRSVPTALIDAPSAERGSAGEGSVFVAA